MLDMLKQTGRPEMVVGWYHSHPGFGCWLSGVDINTQQSFEALSDRAVAVVVDPIQSVKGKVVIDAFRLINPNMMVLGQVRTIVYILGLLLFQVSKSFSIFSFIKQNKNFADLQFFVVFQTILKTTFCNSEHL